jgi:hypothetical protein
MIPKRKSCILWTCVRTRKDGRFVRRRTSLSSSFVKGFHLDTRTLTLSVETLDEPIACLALRNHREGLSLRTSPCSVTTIFQLACAATRGFAVLDGGSRLHHLCKPLPEHRATYVKFNATTTAVFCWVYHSKEHGISGRLWMYDSDRNAKL